MKKSIPDFFSKSPSSSKKVVKAKEEDVDNNKNEVVSPNSTPSRKKPRKRRKRKHRVITDEFPSENVKIVSEKKKKIEEPLPKEKVEETPKKVEADENFRKIVSPKKEIQEKEIAELLEGLDDQDITVLTSVDDYDPSEGEIKIKTFKDETKIEKNERKTEVSDLFSGFTEDDISNLMADSSEDENEEMGGEKTETVKTVEEIETLQYVKHQEIEEIPPKVEEEIKVNENTEEFYQNTFHSQIFGPPPVKVKPLKPVKPLQPKKKNFRSNVIDDTVPTEDVEMKDDVIVRTVYERSELWVNKYQPKKLTDLIGNKENINVLSYWLLNWENNHLFKKPKPKGISNQSRNRYNKLYEISKKKKAVILSGIPGVGKTSSARLVCLENGYEIIEMNASDARSAKKLEKNINHLVNNKSIRSFFRSRQDAKLKKKMCVIMDEVDGMSVGDRGGIKVLIKLIEKAKIPIICICNDRYKQSIKSLVTKCLDLRFKQPNNNDICRRMMHIARGEELDISSNDVMNIIISQRGDIRSVLNNLQFISKIPDNARKNMAKSLENSRKDIIESSVFMGTTRLLQKRMGMREHLDLFYIDSALIPLFVHQNYVNVEPYNVGFNLNERMSRIASASEDMSFGDTINLKIRKDQNYKLSNDFAMSSVVAPCLTIKGNYRQIFGFDRNVGFPASLGKYSTLRKNRSTVTQISDGSSLTLRSNRSNYSLDFLPVFVEKTSRVLLKEKEDAFERVSKFMGEYGITRENLEQMEELVFLKKHVVWKNIPTKVKRGFTMFHSKKMKKITELRKGRRNRKEYFGFSESDVSDTDSKGFELVSSRIKVGDGSVGKSRKRKRKSKSKKKKKKRKIDQGGPQKSGLQKFWKK